TAKSPALSFGLIRVPQANRRAKSLATGRLDSIAWVVDLEVESRLCRNKCPKSWQRPCRDQRTGLAVRCEEARALIPPPPYKETFCTLHRPRVDAYGPPLPSASS